MNQKRVYLPLIDFITNHSSVVPSKHSTLKIVVTPLNPPIANIMSSMDCKNILYFIKNNRFLSGAVVIVW